MLNQIAHLKMPLKTSTSVGLRWCDQRPKTGRTLQLSPMPASMQISCVNYRVLVARLQRPPLLHCQWLHLTVYRNMMRRLVIICLPSITTPANHPASLCWRHSPHKATPTSLKCKTYVTAKTRTKVLLFIVTYTLHPAR